MVQEFNGGSEIGELNSCIFITGFTGFVGRFLVESLISRKKSSEFYLLVRKRSLDRARKILNSFDLSPGNKQRIHLVVGDITRKDLDLKDSCIGELKDRVIEVFHLAAIYKLNVNKDLAERINIKGTENVLKLASKFNNLSRLNYFSTCYVAGDRDGVILETELSRGQGFKNLYEKTKFDAEVIVRNHLDKLPITIYRPSTIVGHSRTGEINKIDGIYYLMEFIHRFNLGFPLPYVGSKDAILNFVPVDFVVESVIELSQIKEAEGKTFHLSDPDPPYLKDVYSKLHKLMTNRYSRGRLPWQIIYISMYIPLMEKAAGSPKESLLHLGKAPIFDNRNVKKLLNDKVQCPILDNYLDKLVDFYQKNF